MKDLPFHLRKYIVEQDEAKYTAIDHSVWRYVLRQLRNFLKVHAHECYLDGLEKTGIEVEHIPKISDISKKLEQFGWRALPVSGFIPPAAFMEMQSLGILPIASDMRSLGHLMYTPAPDIVHEAAGHAPILIHPEFANYLREYAQVAKKAIISMEDMELYKAIRILSDVKENPNSSAEEVKLAEEDLEKKSKNITFISEAAQLGRMNWWTAEYGLIGEMSSPKIFGAGLLSSVGESRMCLSDSVKKIPLTINCINQTYDITEPQPQLFVAKNFQDLHKVLHEFSEQMSFRQGGIESLKKIQIARTVNTVQLNSGLQISGELKKFITDSGKDSSDLGSISKNENVAYLQFQGPTQISFEDREIPDHGKSYHNHGFGTPVGYLKKFPTKCPSELNDSEFTSLGLQLGQTVTLDFTSGVKITGMYLGRIIKKGRTVMISLKEATAKFNSLTLFEPAWGNFDVALGSSIPSVFGGPADRETYGELEDFVVKKVTVPPLSEKQKQLNYLYSDVRYLRENQISGETLKTGLEKIYKIQNEQFPEEWLLKLEIYELSLKIDSNLSTTLKSELEKMKTNLEYKILIEDGLSLAGQ